MLPHERKKFLCGPALGLKIIVVGSRGTRVHLQYQSISIRQPRYLQSTYHEVDGGPASQDMGARHNSSAPVEPFGRPRIVEGSSLAVQLHVPGVNSGAEHPESAIRQHYGYIVGAFRPTMGCLNCSPQLRSTGLGGCDRGWQVVLRLHICCSGLENGSNDWESRIAYPQEPPPATMIST
jgi:hypothetical protein